MKILMSMLVSVMLLAAAAPAATVHIKNDAFSPAVVTVHTGDTVLFENDDDDAHTVTASGNAFDSKALDTDGRWQHTFTKPGTYAYFCQLHPFMKGTVVVKDGAR